MADRDDVTPRARILVVDDDASSREGLTLLLHIEGFVVACASDGQSALEEVPRFEPDVVLTDLHMPRLDGIGLCTKLRELDPMLPVILMTVNDDAAAVLRGLRAGLNDYLVKPLDIDLVLWSLRRAIGERAMQIEQEQLRARNVQLCEEARSTVKRYEEVLSVVSHDLKNPLGVIHLCAQQLLADPKSGRATLESVETIVRSVARSNRLIASLLDDVRLRGDGIILDLDRHTIDELLADVGDLRPLALHRGLELEIEPAPAGLALLCDRARMAQVLSNLVGNAIKFSPRGGNVGVRVDIQGGDVRFAVSDRGPGIADAARPHLFERFWQSPGRTLSGIGLGLYIARGVVAAHGGRIWVESTAGAGSTFFVSVPVGLQTTKAEHDAKPEVAKARAAPRVSTSHSAERRIARAQVAK